MCKSKPSCGCGCSDNQIREDKKKDSKYQAFFKKALKKFKIDDPGDLTSDKKKKEFYNWIDDNYKAKNETLDKWADILDQDAKELDSKAKDRQISHKYNKYAKVTQKRNSNKPNATNYDNMDYDDRTDRQKKYGKSRRHEAYENAIRNLIRRELSAMNEGSFKLETYYERKLKDGRVIKVTNRDTSKMRGTQDKFYMAYYDKSGKKTKDIGSHPSKDGAIHYVKKMKVDESAFSDSEIRRLIRSELRMVTESYDDVDLSSSEKRDLKRLRGKEYQSEFIEWYVDGNAIKFEDGYSTQQTMWRARYKTIFDLYDWFVKEFFFD